MQSIEQRVIQRLAAKFGGTPKSDDSLALLGVDSVGMAELTLELEKEFDIHVGDDIVEVDTVEELADYVRKRQPAEEA